MIDVTWRKDFPPEVRTALEPMLEQWGALLPTWCQEFIVSYDGARDAQMAATVNYRNRWVVLRVTGLWIDNANEERENSLRHEMIHVLLEPMAMAVARIIEDTVPEDTPLAKLCNSVFTDGLEATVEDMARAVGRIAPHSGAKMALKSAPRQGPILDG